MSTESSGVYLGAVFASSAAARSGLLRRGDQLLEINGWAVTTAGVAECRALLQTPGARAAVLTVRRAAPGFGPFADADAELALDCATTAVHRASVASLRQGGSAGLEPAVVREASRTVVVERQPGQHLGLSVLGPSPTDDMATGGIYVNAITFEPFFHLTHTHSLF